MTHKIITINEFIAYLVYKCTKIMNRKSITFTEANETFLNAVVKTKGYATKSEYINSLIRKEREQTQHNLKLNKWLDKADKSGYIEISKEDLFKEITGKNLNDEL